jgi:hypothetical protein
LVRHGVALNLAFRATAPATKTESTSQPNETSKPRFVAGRAIIASYQRFTLGKPAKSTWWRS